MMYPYQGVLGACELGDGFSCGGDEFGACEVLVGAVGFGSCGVEGCGADEVLEVVYWVCVVMLPIGLSHLGVSKSYHSGDRDTRWAFCYSRGRGVGMLKWQTSGSPCKQGEPRPFGSPREAGGNLKEGGNCKL